MLKLNDEFIGSNGTTYNNLNTSHVKVKRQYDYQLPSLHIYLNTSHVKVKHYEQLENDDVPSFKYISC